MSLALSTSRANVRQLIRDVDISPAAVKGYVVDQAISNHYQLVHARLRVPLEWLTLTALAVADSDYTVSASEFHTIGLFRLLSNHHLVEKIGPAAMGQLRAAGTSNGEPYSVALTEENPAAVGTTETTIQVYPTPTAVDTLQGLYSTVASTVTADADLLQLGQNGQRAIEYSAAAELLDAMTDEDAKRLGISKAIAKKYEEQARQFIYWEQVRMSRQRTSRIANTSYKSP